MNFLMILHFQSGEHPKAIFQKKRILWILGEMEKVEFLEMGIHLTRCGLKS